MLRRFVIFITILVYTNGAMLLPRVAEVDIHNEQGRQQKDIDTVIEYIDEVIIGNRDRSPLDKDSDQGQNFHPGKLVDYNFEIDFTPIKQKTLMAASKQQFCLLPQKKLYPVIVDILAPPPKSIVSV